MDNLLDTHTFIWFIEDANELSNTAKSVIEAPDSINYISIASLWEIAIKVSLGKLKLQTSFKQINNQLEFNGFILLPVSFEDTLTVSELPYHHRDPFDRIIIAQCINKNLTFVTLDKSISKYAVNTFG